MLTRRCGRFLGVLHIDILAEPRNLGATVGAHQGLFCSLNSEAKLDY